MVSNARAKDEVAFFPDDLPGQSAKGRDILHVQTSALLAKGRQPKVLGLAALGLTFILMLIGEPIVCIPAGHRAVVDLFGHAFHDTLQPGIQLKTIYARVHLFTVKTQLLDVSLSVPTMEGLLVQLDVSVLFHARPDAVRDIYTTVGNDYIDVLMQPEVTSTIRSLTSRVSAKALYSADRDVISDGIVKQLNERLNRRGIEVEQALLRKVVLPRLVTAAIEEKLKAEQESQRMEFILDKERQEAERKRIEAQGISDFQRIVSQGISSQLLEWKGIEATERLAGSRNTKIVIVGSSKNGLPLILGDHQGDTTNKDTDKDDNNRDNNKDLNRGAAGTQAEAA